jgi:hypothetical protein
LKIVAGSEREDREAKEIAPASSQPKARFCRHNQDLCGAAWVGVLLI